MPCHGPHSYSLASFFLILVTVATSWSSLCRSRNSKLGFAAYALSTSDTSTFLRSSSTRHRFHSNRFLDDSCRASTITAVASQRTIGGIIAMRQWKQRQKTQSDNRRSSSSSNQQFCGHRTQRYGRLSAVPSDDDNPNDPMNSVATSERPLSGCVALITGASRGIGRGIAIELGRAGATVYVTGTSSTSSQQHENKASSESARYAAKDEDVGTIESTAQSVTKAGGVGIPILCDHSNDEQTRAAFEQIKSEQGRLDILVNNAFRIPPGGPTKLFGKFWDLDIQTWDYIHTIGLRNHYVASVFGVPIMLQNKPFARGNMARPLIVMISSFGGLTYSFNTAYGVGKAGVDRLAKDMSVELLPRDIAVMSLYPGVVMTERTQRLVESGEWTRQVKIPLDNAESPEFTGRAIVAIATDKNNIHQTGTFQVVAELAQHYGFTDVNGRTPPSIRSLKFLLPAYGMDEDMRKRVPGWLIPDIKLPFWVMAQGKPPDPDEVK